MHARLMTQRKNHTNGGDVNVNVEVKGSGGRLFENIRILNIYGDMVDPKKMILDLKPCFEFLETLKIELLRPSSTTINIFAILDNGPRLKFVEIVVLRDSFVEAVQDDTTATTTIIPTPPATVPIQASVAEEPTSQQKKFYPLQHLIMHGLWIDSVATAERILKTCPDLRVIKSIKIETSNMHSNRTQWESSLMLAASKYLAELARDLCPNLTWYQSDLIYEYQLPKDIRLIELAQIFPEMRTLSMITFEDIGPIATPFRPPYLPAYETPHLSSLINTFLNRLTTLEVISRFYYEVNWTAINRILCLCPLLQHLLVPDIFIITNSISLPSNDTLEDYNNRFYPEEFPWLYDESNKKSRARERAERQHLRELILPVDRNDFNNYPQMSSGRPVPRIWPSRHTLRTLDCSLETSYGLKDFTRHIRAYRLFGHLTVFKIRCVDLKIGQIKACVPSANKKSKSTSQSASSLRRGRLNMSEIRSRYRNDLLALKGLVYLEELVVETARLPGRVVPEDFEFLRRKEPDFGFRFFPAPSISSARTTPSRNKVVEHMDENGDYDVGDHEERESEDSEDENDYGRVEAYKDVETFWPRLTIFHIGYVITHPVNDPKILVPAVEEIRPGVSFRLRLSPNSSKEFF
ncbi:hypothetical protein BGZ97_012808 [Linnemannia gamsii]|uniref:Uncharacterized protein n=1 Tax=Linnemannia gamsii TaxID=64522 RepID=A0A9P6R0R7_9FUNG|nr:hypothetical protein BGZ97_012808 [Linnemannia gamsii]